MTLVSSHRKNILAIAAVITLLLAAAVAGGIYIPKLLSDTSAPVDSAAKPAANTTTPEPTSESAEGYKGKPTSVANTFFVSVPNGWAASISKDQSFLAIMFARPEKLQSLKYNEAKTPVIDSNGIPAWSGLTEHFFIRAPSTSQQFTQSDHQEVSSTSFTFADGTVGKKYYVVKHAEEAKKWGGLLRDSEWQGRTYIYEKDGKRIEAHLALYPSTSIDIPFFESVVRTITTES